MGLLAQFADDFSPDMGYGTGWLYAPLVIQFFWFLYAAFWVWMVWHCLKTEPDRWFWLWVMIVVQFIGPALYFALRYLPSNDFRAPAFLRRWTRGRELARLETAAIQIGNAHQFVQWGEALREVGRLDEAAEAYSRALKKEPQNLQALWGAAQVAAAKKRPDDARNLTRQILDKDSQYKFGDVSLAHGRALVELGDRESATSHFERHVRRWRHPEAVYLLARLCADQGHSGTARQHLQSLLHDINGSPAAIARKHGRWRSRAKQLLRKLPAA